MGKSKMTVYLLGFAVLSIWGVIVYQLFDTVNDSALEATSGLKTAVTQKGKVPKLYPDTFKLRLDFADPFTGKPGKVLAQRDTMVRKPRAMVSATPVTPAVPQVNPVEQIKYHGYVSDPAGKVKLAIVNYKGSQKMMKEGDTAGPVKILLIKPNAMLVRHKGKTTTIKTQ